MNSLSAAESGHLLCEDTQFIDHTVAFDYDVYHTFIFDTEFTESITLTQVLEMLFVDVCLKQVVTMTRVNGH